MDKIKIKAIDGDFSICKVKDYSKVNLDAKFCFTGKTDEEKSLVCLTEDVPDNTDYILVKEENYAKAKGLLS